MVGSPHRFVFSATPLLSTPANVTSVVAPEIGVAFWTFDSPVTLQGPARPDLQASITGPGGYQQPTAVAQAGPAVLRADYAIPIDVDGTWQVLDGTTGLDPTTPIVVPESGVIT